MFFKPERIVQKEKVYFIFCLDLFQKEFDPSSG